MYWHILPQLFPLLTNALMRLRVSLRVYTINELSQQGYQKYHGNRHVFERTSLDLSVDLLPYMRTFPKGRIYGKCRHAGKHTNSPRSSSATEKLWNCLPVLAYMRVYMSHFSL